MSLNPAGHSANDYIIFSQAVDNSYLQSATNDSRVRANVIVFHDRSNNNVIGSTTISAVVDYSMILGRLANVFIKIETDMESLQSNIRLMQSDIAQINASTATMSSNIAAMTTSIDRSTSNIAAMRTSVDTLSTQVSVIANLAGGSGIHSVSPWEWLGVASLAEYYSQYGGLTTANIINEKLTNMANIRPNVEVFLAPYFNPAP